MELLPELITKTFMMAGIIVGLNSGNHHRIKNILNGTTTTEIVHWFVKPLQDGPNSQRPGFALNRLVCIIACI